MQTFLDIILIWAGGLGACLWIPVSWAAKFGLGLPNSTKLGVWDGHIRSNLANFVRITQFEVWDSQFLQNFAKSTKLRIDSAKFGHILRLGRTGSLKFGILVKIWHLGRTDFSKFNKICQNSDKFYVWDQIFFKAKSESTFFFYNFVVDKIYIFL